MKFARSLILLALWLLTMKSAWSQELNVPTLQTTRELNVPIATAEDTSTINKIIRLANAIKQISTDSARNLLHQALELNQEVYYPDGLATIYIEYAVCAVYDGNYEQGIQLLHQANEYARQAIYDISPTILRLYNYLAVAYNYIGRDDYSLYYHFKSLQYAMQFTTPTNALAGFVPLAYTNIGITLYRVKQYDQSLEYLFTAEKLSLIMRLHEYLGEIYTNIAKHFRLQANWARHDYYMREALRWNDTLAARDPIRAQKQYMSIMSSLGESYLTRNNPQEALNYFQKARRVQHGVSPYENKLLIDKGLGTAYLKLKDWENAKKYLFRALETTEELNVKSPVTASLYQTLADFFYEIGDVNKAYTFQKRYSQLNDSLLMAERLRDINRLEIQYRASEKDKSIARQDLLLAEKAREIQDKNILIAGTTVLVAILCLIIFSIRRHSKHKEEIEKLHARIEGGEQERSRIGRELHDGIMVQFSAVKMNLSTLINRYSHIQGIEAFKEPIEQLDNATRELRRTAHNLMPAILLKEGLVDAVYFFCKNLEQSISLSIHVQSFGTIPQLPKEAELSIYRIIQELVHNIVKHAKASRALIELSGQNNLLLISVEDDGIGLPEQVIGQHETGVGLSTIRNRVAALNGTIAIQSSAGKGTVFNIEFDITHLLNSEKKLKHVY